MILAAVFACVTANARTNAPGLALATAGGGEVLVSSLFQLPVYMALGVLTATVTYFFRFLVKWFTRFYAGGVQNMSFMGYLQPEQRPVVASLVCGVAACFRPETLFEGGAMFKSLCAGAVHPIGWLASLLAIKVALTASCAASGLMGGTFMPALFFGAAAGAVYSGLLTNVGLAIADPSIFAALGAAACLAAVFRAPITAAILLFELTRLDAGLGFGVWSLGFRACKCASCVRAVAWVRVRASGSIKKPCANAGLGAAALVGCRASVHMHEVWCVLGGVSCSLSAWLTLCVRCFRAGHTRLCSL